MIYLLTAIGLTPGGSSTVHIYTQTIHRTTKKKQTIHRTTQKKYIEQQKKGGKRNTSYLQSYQSFNSESLLNVLKV
jgi:hypothetical protein